MPTAATIETFNVAANGNIPNNPDLPFIVYRDGWTGGSDPNKALATLAGNGWGGGWVNGVFPFHHYHAESHEVLLNLGPSITVLFGGPKGRVLDFHNRDVVLIPAGGGHCLVGEARASAIVGAYPAGQEDWDLKRDQPGDYQLALQQIPHVPLPATDPLTGVSQPLLDHWTHRD